MPPNVPCSSCFTMQTLSSLKRCSKCKCTYYCSEVCQRRHWGLHKKTCTGAPETKISSWTEHQCFEKIKDDLMRTVPGTKDTVAAMQRLYNLMREERGGFFNSRFDDIGLDLHTITRTIAQMPSSYYNELWACPGMCQFLLTHQLGCRPNGAVQTYVNRKLSDDHGSNSRDTRFDSDDDDDEI